MRTILVISSPVEVRAPGAAEKDIAATVAELSALGYRVLFCTVTPPRTREIFIEKAPLAGSIKTYDYQAPRMPLWAWIGRAIRKPALLDRASIPFWHFARSVHFQNLLHDEHVDVVFSFCSFTWPVLEKAREAGVRTVMRSHNYESSFFVESLESWERFYPSNWVRTFGKFHSEKSALLASDAVGTLPIEEIGRYRSWNPTGTHILTLVFAGRHIRPPFVHKKERPYEVFYLGANYKVPFHRRGAERLILDIAPRVAALAPETFRFHVCGARLSEALRNQCDGKWVIYEDYVPDLEGFLARMDIGAFPVWTGRTMKGKVFEALCRAFPIVIPVNGLGGYDLKNGREVLVADDIETFARCIVSLSDENLRRKLSEGAARIAQQEFGMDSIRATLKVLVED